MATWGLLRLAPKILKITTAFYDGAKFTVELRDHIAAMEARLTVRLDNLDDGQLNMLVKDRQSKDNDAETAYFETNRQGKTEWVSKTWSRWTGIDNDAARGNGWENGITPEDRERVMHNWNMAIDHERDYVDTYSYIDRAGRRTLVEVMARPIRRKDGTILNYFGSARLSTPTS